MVERRLFAVEFFMDGAPLMTRFDNDHHGTVDAARGAVHTITFDRASTPPDFKVRHHLILL